MYHLAIATLLISQVHANIGWGSYSYKYLSAIVRIAPEIVDLESAEQLPNEGAYGYASSYSIINGQLIQPEPVEGCPASPAVGQGTEGEDAFYNLTTLQEDDDGEKVTWIALIARGDCLFTEKIDLAYNQGAIAAIIYNGQAQTVVPMEYTSPAQDFVAIMVDYDTYDGIDQALAQDPVVYAQISPGEPKTNNSFERIVIATISVSFLILLALSVGWVIIYYVQRFRIIHRRYREAKRRQDLAERAIKQLKNKKLKKNDRAVVEEDSCPICIDNFEAGGNCLELPCHHLFHKKCIEPWVLDKGTCPMCKINIFVALGLETEEQAAANTTTGNTNPTAVFTGEVSTTDLSNVDNLHADIGFDERSRSSSSISSNSNNTSTSNNHPEVDDSPLSPSHLHVTETNNSRSSSSSHLQRAAPSSPLPGVEAVVLSDGGVHHQHSSSSPRLSRTEEDDDERGSSEISDAPGNQSSGRVNKSYRSDNEIV